MDDKMNKEKRAEYIREYAKANTKLKKIRVSLEDDAIIDEYCMHKGVNFSTLVRNLIISDMNKNGWTKLIKSPNKTRAKNGNV